jgi:acyl carrier protein
MMSTRNERLEIIQEIVAEVLEVDTSEITETSRFREDHHADSLRALEVLARLEKEFKVELPPTLLPKMTHLAAVYDIVREKAGWLD